MTLDEAIKHLEEMLSDESHEWSCESCKQEHEQLLEWLKELKVLKEKLQGDLISRSELIKVLKENEWISDDPFAECGGLEELINNAQPVKVYTLSQVKELVEFNQKLIDELEEKPEGEWILQYCSCGDRYYTCSICNRTIEVKNGQSLKDYPFCHCGAKMKGNVE